MSDFSALHAAMSGMLAAQIGLTTASNNIANASTEGYTRQRVTLSPHLPRRLPQGQIGLGVSVDGIERLRERFLDTRYRTDLAAAGATSVRASLFQRAEAVLAEPGNGLSGQLSALWASFEDAALNPPDPAGRQNVISQLDSLSSRVRDLAVQWDAIEGDETLTLQDTIRQANGLLEEVGDLNLAILDAGAIGSAPNDLMDRRDLVVDQLTELIGVGVSAEHDGSYKITLNGMALVSGTRVSQLEVDPTTYAVSHPSGVEVSIGGKAAGTQSFLQDDLPGIRGALDDFVVELADALNATHAAGWVSETTQGGDLLAYDPGSPARTLSVAITDPAQLALAASGGPPFPDFDGGNAEALAGLRTALIAGGGTTTFDGAYAAVVTSIAQESASASLASQSQETLLASSEASRLSAHSVSLDEEMVSLMEYQRMYEAAARALSAVDEALDVLVNRTGLVGR